jgi:hypothetical protein
MLIKEMLKIVEDNNHMINHKIYPEGVKMQPSDWIRIYKSKHHGCIDKGIYSCDYKDRDKIPQEFLDLELDHVDSWFIGGDLSLDFIIK